MKKILIILFFLGLILVISGNCVLYNHAYNFTHFADNGHPKMTLQKVEKKSLVEHLKLAFFGIKIPKSKNKLQPTSFFQNLQIGKNPQLDTWWLPSKQSSKGTVLLFHGYTSSKSHLLQNAYTFQRLGYHCLLVDFRAHGDSEGLECTIGYKEAEDVKRCYDYIYQQHPNLPIILFGTSMGAVSILKAIHDYDLQPQKIIIECPFKDMYTAIEQRFLYLNLPTFLLPDILLFWGDWQTGIKSRKHSTVTYANSVSVPTLLLYGSKDQRVARFEIDAVFQALAGTKKLVVFKEAGHEHLINHSTKEWTSAIWEFLDH